MTSQRSSSGSAFNPLMENSESTPNYYEILGVSISSSSSEIKKAYHNIARKHHPDRNNTGDVELFKKATIAYSFLQDPNQKKLYDIQLRNIRSSKAWDISSNRHKTQTPAFGRSRATESSAEQTHHAHTQSFTSSAAAASAAFNSFASAATMPSVTQRNYTRRPRETKFSKRESPSKMSSTNSEPADRAKESLKDGLDFSHSDSSHQTDQPCAAPSGPPPDNTVRSSGSSTDSASIVGGTKRKPETTETSPKRRRVFEMDELRQVPPFTQSHGTSFKFSSLNGALPRVPSPRKRMRSRFTGKPDVSHTDETLRPLSTDLKLQDLLHEFTDSSAPLFNGLVALHNERVSLNGSNISSAHDNFTKTKALLEDLIIATNKALQLLENVPISS